MPRTQVFVGPVSVWVAGSADHCLPPNLTITVALDAQNRFRTLASAVHGVTTADGGEGGAGEHGGGEGGHRGGGGGQPGQPHNGEVRPGEALPYEPGIVLVRGKVSEGTGLFSKI